MHHYTHQTTSPQPILNCIGIEKVMTIVVGVLQVVVLVLGAYLVNTVLLF